MSRFDDDNPETNDLEDIINSLSEDSYDDDEYQDQGDDLDLDNDALEKDDKDDEEDNDEIDDADDYRDDEQDEDDDDIYGNDNFDEAADNVKDKAEEVKDKVEDKVGDKIDEQKEKIKDKVKDKVEEKFKEKKDNKSNKSNKNEELNKQKDADEFGNDLAKNKEDLSKNHSQKSDMNNSDHFQDGVNQFKGDAKNIGNDVKKIGDAGKQGMDNLSTSAGSPGGDLAKQSVDYNSEATKKIGENSKDLTNSANDGLGTDTGSSPTGSGGNMPEAPGGEGMTPPSGGATPPPAGEAAGMGEGAGEGAAALGEGAAATGEGVAAAGEGAAAAGEGAAGAVEGVAGAIEGGATIVELGAAVGIILLIIIAVILLIIFIVCAVTFFTSMPAMLFGKIKQTIANWQDVIRNFIDGDQAERAIQEDDVRSLAQYMQDMGYDIQGYGLGDVLYEEEEQDEKVVGTDGKTQKNADGTDVTVKQYNQVTSTSVRGDVDSNLSQKSSDYKTGNNTQSTKEIKYIVTEDETHIFEGKESRDQVKLGKDAIEKGAVKYLEDYMIATSATYMEKEINVAGKFKTFSAFFFPTGSKKYSEGMINPEFGMGRKVKIEGTTMTITEHASATGILSWGDTYKFDMKDWTALYGRPIELFLSLHFATMMPDLTDTIATSEDFDTVVNIGEDKYDVTMNDITLKIGEETYHSIDIAREALKYCTRNKDSSDDDEEAEADGDAGDEYSSADTADDGTNANANTDRDSDIPCEQLFNDMAAESEAGNLTDEDTIHMTAKILQIVKTTVGGSIAGNGDADNGTGDWNNGSNVKSALEKYCGDVARNNANFQKIEKNGFTKKSGFNNYYIAEESFAGESIPAGPFAGKLTRGQLCQMARLVRPEEDQDYDMYMPYIKNVEKHWYYEDIDFMPVYKTAKTAKKKIDIDIDSNSSSFNLLSQLGDDVKMTADSTLKTGVRYQEEDPETKGPNDRIKSVFLDHEYYKYDGTLETALKIAICRAIDEGKGSGDIIFFNGYEYTITSDDVNQAKGKTGASSKDIYQKGWKRDLYKKVQFDSKDNTMSAFSILEGADTDEAEVCLRCLKELLVELGYYKKEDLMSKYSNVLKWCFSQKGTRGQDWILDRNGVEYGLEVKGLNKVDEEDSSVINYCKVKAPGDGVIIKKELETGTTHVWNETTGKYDTETTTGYAITIKFGLMSEKDTENWDKKLNDDYYEIEKDSTGKQGVTVLDKTMTIKYMDPDNTYRIHKGVKEDLEVNTTIEKGDELGYIVGYNKTNASEIAHSAFITMENADGTEIGRKKKSENRKLLTSAVTGIEEEEDVTMYDDIEDFMSPKSATDWFDGIDYSEDEVMTILSIIAAEAGPSDELGVKAVCSVVVNRVNSDGYPDTIYDVLTAPNQFEAYSEGDTSHGWYQYFSGQAELSDEFRDWVDEIFCSGEAIHEYHSFKTFPNPDPSKYDYSFDNDTNPTSISFGGGSSTPGEVISDDPSSGNFYHN